MDVQDGDTRRLLCAAGSYMRRSDLTVDGHSALPPYCEAPCIPLQLVVIRAETGGAAGTVEDGD